MTTEYAAAMEAHTAAARAYREALADYRALKISDAEFIKARDAKLAADAAFDAAFAKEAAL